MAEPARSGSGLIRRAPLALAAHSVRSQRPKHGLVLSGLFVGALLMLVVHEPARASDRLVRASGSGLSQSPGSAAVNRPAEEAGASELLAFAEEDLAQGRTGKAQRLFEILVARYPETEAASAARRRLGPLYLDLPPGPAVQSPVATPSAATRGSDGPWHQEVHRDVALGDDVLRRIGDRVFFSDGSAELGQRARGVIAAQAAFLRQNAGLAVTIEGHADDPGDSAANHRLALARAEAVRAGLVGEGITPGRIDIMSHGNAERIAVCAEAMCAAQNRRAVTVVRERLEGATQAAAPR